MDSLTKENPVLVFSKSYCSYSTSVKETLSSVIRFGFCSDVKTLSEETPCVAVIELDKVTLGGDGAAGVAIELALSKRTKQDTVPQVFIGGKHIGGRDDTFKYLDRLREEADSEALGAFEAMQARKALHSASGIPRCPSKILKQ